MWWRSRRALPPVEAHPNGRARARMLRGLVFALPLALGGCLHPMYGQFAEGGPGLQAELAAIAIEPIPDRIGHYLGDDLVFDLNGTGSHPTPKYRLFVTLNEGVQTPLIDTVSGRASSATVVINADYRLVAAGTGLPITSGKAFVFKSYDRTSERFSNTPCRPRCRDPRCQAAIRPAPHPSRRSPGHARAALRRSRGTTRR